MCAKTRSSHEAGSVGNETKRLDFRERNETRGLTTTLANNQQRGQSDGELRGRADAGDGRGVRPQRESSRAEGEGRRKEDKLVVRWPARNYRLEKREDVVGGGGGPN